MRLRYAPGRLLAKMPERSNGSAFVVDNALHTSYLTDDDPRRR